MFVIGKTMPPNVQNKQPSTHLTRTYQLVILITATAWSSECHDILDAGVLLNVVVVDSRTASTHPSVIFHL